VQAHPARVDQAHELAERVGGQVVFDPEPNHPRKSPWRTYRACLEAAPGFASGFAVAGSATHVLVVQDDAEPCVRFIEALPLAVQARPDRVLVFHVSGNPYDHRWAVLNACSQDWAWAVLGTDRWCSAVATCWPTTLVHPFLRWVDEQPWPPSFTADDEIIGRYLRHIAHKPLASVPSLVEHPDRVPSLLGKKERGGRDPGRVAACFADNCAGLDVTAIDWTAGPA